MPILLRLWILVFNLTESRLMTQCVVLDEVSCFRQVANNRESSNNLLQLHYTDTVNVIVVLDK